MLELMLEKAIQDNQSRFTGGGTLSEIRQQFLKMADVRKRRYRYKCSSCGSRDIVYRWKKKFMASADGRWFCFCGWSEKPDKGSTLKEWKKGTGFQGH